MSTIDFVSLVEKNPLTQLSGTYQYKLLEKIKQTFTDQEQQLFVSSYYCYLNYHPIHDFAIDLDNVWKWLGFCQKAMAKRLLETFFVLDKDYKCLLCRTAEQKSEGRGGHNKQTILLNIHTFKRLCMKAATAKADQIHDYFIKLEDLLHATIQEETDELRRQLESQKSQIVSASVAQSNLLQQTLLEQFPINTQCIYYGVIADTLDTHPQEQLIKFGHSNNLPTRVKQHQRTFSQFFLIKAFRVDNRTQIENAIKTHPILLKHRRILQIGNTKHNEILGGISFDDLNKVIQEIIHQIEFSSENYIKLWKILQDTKEENKSLTERNKVLSQECSRIQSEHQELVNTIQSSSSESLYKLKKENKKLTNEVYKIKREFKAYIRNHPSNSTLDESVQDISSSTVTEPTVLDRSRLRVFQRQCDGNYHINGKIYSVLTGTREEVWNDIAYRTAGELTKDDFIIGYRGNIVSKKKHEHCHNNPRLPVLISKSLITHTDSFPSSHSCTQTQL